MRKGFKSRGKQPRDTPMELSYIDAFHDVSAKMAASNSIGESLQHLVTAVNTLLPVDVSFISLGDLPAGDLYNGAVIGNKTDSFAQSRFPFRDDLRNDIIRDRSVRYVKNCMKEADTGYKELLKNEGIFSGLIVPVQTANSDLGLLSAFARSGISFSQDMKNIISACAMLAAIDISRRRAEQELKKFKHILDKEEADRISALTQANEQLMQEISERENAEKALRIETERLHALSHHSPLGMLMVTRSGRFEYLNPRFSEMVGYSLKDVPDLNTWFETAYPDTDYRKKVIESWQTNQQQAQTGKAQSSVFIVTCKDKTKKIIDFRMVRLESGSSILTCIDITEQETILDALRRSKEEYASLFTSMRDAFAYQRIELDGNGNPVDWEFLDVNEAFERLVGHGRDFIVKHRIAEVIPGLLESSFDWLSVYGDVALRGEDVRFEEYVEPLGKWLSISAYSPRKNHFVTLIHDITDRREAEQEVERQSRFLENVFDSLTHPFFVVDAQTFTISMANEASGITEPGLTCFQQLHGESKKCHCIEEGYSCPIRESTETKKPVRVEHVHYDQAGRTRHVEVHAHPLLGSSGEVTQVIAYHLDITERKRAEQLLVETERLKAVGELAAGVAHNFNNLLQVVLGKTQMAAIQLDTGNIDQTKSTLEQVLESLRLGAETVKRLQSFARTRSQIAVSECVVFDLSDTVEQAVEMSKPWWKAGKGADSDITLDKEIMPGCFIKAKPSELFEVAVNLIKNAVEALPEGGTIAIRTTVENGDVVMIVSDTGIGISNDDMGKIFEPFWTTKGVKGTGMGLASSYGIVTSHGGDISVESTPGSGSIFTVRLPYTAVTAGYVSDGSAEDYEERISFLIIDDMPQVLSIIRDGLKMSGHVVTTALSGADGLKNLEENDVDVVVCDLALNEMSGWDVGSSIIELYKEEPESKPIVILLTGWGTEAVESDRLEHHGINGVLEKPIEPAELLKMAREMVVRRRNIVSES